MFDTTEKGNTSLKAGAKVLRMFLKKKFRKDRFGSCVEPWIVFFDQQHLVHKTFKLCAAFA